MTSPFRFVSLSSIYNSETGEFFVSTDKLEALRKEAEWTKSKKVKTLGSFDEDKKAGLFFLEKIENGSIFSYSLEDGTQIKRCEQLITVSL